MVEFKNLDDVKAKCRECCVCAPGSGRKNIVFSDGNPDAKIMIIGEAPGASEDETGIPFVGRAGKLLTQFLEEAGISREKDVYICNVLKCRPPENRVPTKQEIAACDKFLQAQIDFVRPKLIVLCGKSACSGFIKEKFVISQIRGKFFDIERDYGKIKAVAVFHPSYLLRNHSLEKNSPRWLTKQDFLNIKKFLDENC